VPWRACGGRGRSGVYRRTTVANGCQTLTAHIAWLAVRLRLGVPSTPLTATQSGLRPGGDGLSVFRSRPLARPDLVRAGRCGRTELCRPGGAGHCWAPMVRLSGLAIDSAGPGRVGTRKRCPQPPTRPLPRRSTSRQRHPTMIIRRQQATCPPGKTSILPGLLVVQEKGMRVIGCRVFGGATDDEVS
jgi:hypothetical protein